MFKEYCPRNDLQPSECGYNQLEFNLRERSL
jgi:hypothetical protein